MRLRRRQLDAQNSIANFFSATDRLIRCTKFYRMCSFTKQRDCDYYSKSSKTALSLRRNRLNTFFIFLLPLVSFYRTVSTLRCYETENGVTVIREDPAWKFCAVVPVIAYGQHYINGSQFGLGPQNDLLALYGSAFNLHDDVYRILSVCIYERYDFSKLTMAEPQSMVEFTFRCVCNYDLCNSKRTFPSFMASIKEESYLLRNNDMKLK